MYVYLCVERADLLRAQYWNLTIKLDAHIVAVRMYERNALTLRDLQSIQSLRESPVEAAETLLNIIMEQSDAVYLCFLDVLKHTGQQHIYQTLVEDGYRGEQRYIVPDFLENRKYHRIFLTDNLRFIEVYLFYWSDMQ